MAKYKLQRFIFSDLINTAETMKKILALYTIYSIQYRRRSLYQFIKFCSRDFTMAAHLGHIRKKY